MAGRFISPDPAVPDFSGSKNPWNFDPRMLNRYAYCRNNPLIYVDPTGLAMTEANAGDDEGQYSEGPSGDGSGNGDGTEAGRNEKNAPQNDPGDEEEGDSPGKNRKSGKTTVVGWDKLGIDNPLDNPQGQVIEDKNGNRTYVCPGSPNQNLGNINQAKVNLGKVVTGILMRYMGYFTIGVSIISFYGGRIAMKHNTITGFMEATKGFGKAGIISKPGDFMVHKGHQIEKEGWAGQ